MISTNNFTFELIFHRVFHLAVVHFKFAVAQRKQWHLCFSLQLWMEWWAVFTDNDFWKCSWAHAVIFMTESLLFSSQFCLRVRRLRASNSPDSLNLLMILHPVDDGIFKVLTFICLGTLFWICSTICLQIFYFGETLAFKDALFMLNPVPNNLMSCNMFLQLFLYSILYFFSFFLFQLFCWQRFAAIVFKVSS